MPCFTVCIPCHEDLANLRGSLSALFSVFRDADPDFLEIVIGLNDCSFDKSDVTADLHRPHNVALTIRPTERFLTYDQSVSFSLGLAKGDNVMLLGCGDEPVVHLKTAFHAFKQTNCRFGVLPIEFADTPTKISKAQAATNGGGAWVEGRRGFFQQNSFRPSFQQAASR